MHITQAIYGLLVAAILWYKKFRASIEKIGFKVNPYDPCVANKMIDNNQMTLTWHVDDIKSSHVNPKVNDEFLKWLQKEYGQLAAVKATRGKVHDYLGMTLDYNVHGSVRIDMRDYVKGMTEEFPLDHYPKRTVTSAAAENIFSIDPNSPPLSEDQARFFRTIVLKGLFLAKRG